MEDYSRDYFTFEQCYCCYPLQRLDEGDKIILPLSALHLLTNLRLDFPFLFEIRNPNIDRPSHCGVLEFTAEEGTVSLPQWMMDSLCLRDGDLVRLNDARLPRGRYIKLRPHTKDFVALSSVKAVLERKLRFFSCLTAGDTIMILYNGARFYLDVVDTQPSPAVCIIDVDCEVDFAPPLDYVEAERSIAAASDQLFAAATNGPTSEEKVGPNIGPTNGPAAEEEPKFRVFMGTARRLDGAPVTTRIRESTNVGSKVGVQSKPGKVVFGSRNKNQKSEGVDKVVSKLGPKEAEEKNCFQPFTGRKHTLMDG